LTDASEVRTASSIGALVAMSQKAVIFIFAAVIT
jgi:hypothetical protein